MLFKSDKSQITIFIILGLAMFTLVFVSIYFAVSTQVVSDTPVLRRTPVSFRDYVEICLEDVSRVAIMNLGYQGAYIELPSFVRSDLSSFISLDSQSRFGIPSWFYKGSYRIPSFNDMSLEISSIVEERLLLCLDGFSGFNEKFDVEQKSPLVASTTISENTVFVEIDYNIDVISKDSLQIESYESFNVIHNVKLGKMHELGKRIVYSEVKNTNFEQSLIDLMSMNPEIPITTMTFSPRPDEWYLDNIEREIDLMIYNYLTLVRFEGTNHIPFLADESVYQRFRGFNLLDYRAGNIPEGRPDDAYEYFNLYYNPLDLPNDYDYSSIDFSDISVNVKYYPSDNLRVVARPNTGGILRTSMARFPGTPIQFPLQVGHFTYDVDFLLEINMYDEYAFSGDGYVLRFALPVSIRSNMPNKDSQGFVLQEAPVQFENPCDDLDGDYRIRVQGLEGGIDGLDLRGARISFDCISFGCSLGTTRAEYGTYMLSTGLPSTCSGGFFNVEKEGYLPVQVQHLGQRDVVIELQKVETFSVDVAVHSSQNLGFSRPLRDYEIALVRIVPFEHGEEQVILIEQNSDEFIELLADNGKYMIDIVLIDDATNHIIGGYKGPFEYDYTDTFSRRNILLSLVEYNPRPIPLSPEAQFMIMEYIENGEYTDALIPRFFS